MPLRRSESDSNKQTSISPAGEHRWRALTSGRYGPGRRVATDLRIVSRGYRNGAGESTEHGLGSRTVKRYLTAKERGQRRERWQKPIRSRPTASRPERRKNSSRRGARSPKYFPRFHPRP